MPDVLLTTPERAPLRVGTVGHPRVAGVAAALPSTIAPNGDIAARLGVDDDWIHARTGIRERRVLQPAERLTDLAVEAAERALVAADLPAAALDLVLVATTSSDELLPNAAPLVASALGATKAGAMDVGAACTGFLSALALAGAQIEAGRARHVLVVGADALTRFLDHDDRRTAALFGDGAGALVLSDAGEAAAGALGPVVLGADGAREDLIRITREDEKILMDGRETYKNAVERLSESTLSAVTAAGLRLEDIDLFVFHQANGRILRAVGERLGLPADRVVDCIERIGNTSAATLPIALSIAERDGRLEDGSRVLLGAFGAGLTWGAAVIEWGNA